MLHILDANTLIDAKNMYFQMERVPEFWEWLIHQGNLGNIKIPIEIYEEIIAPVSKDTAPDELVEWIKRDDVKEALVLDEESLPEHVAIITENGYASDLSEDEILKIGSDPFLMSYAFKNTENRSVVTTEVSKPSKQRANKKVPDVCNYFGIKCINTFQLLSDLNFKTSWNK